MLYTTYGAFQEQMNKSNASGIRYQFNEMIKRMYDKGMLVETRPALDFYCEVDSCGDEEFDKIIDGLPIDVPPSILDSLPTDVFEDDLIPIENLDAYVVRHPRYTRPLIHSHDYFEVDYVSSGEAVFRFEDAPERVLHEGDVLVIAPGSHHDLTIEDDHTLIYTISMRKSTFNVVFFRLLSGKNVLAYFFRNILKGSGEPNFLLFYTDNNGLIRNHMRHAVIECAVADSMTNAAVISCVQMMFAMVLRLYKGSFQYYDFSIGSEFTPVLQYIQRHYRDDLSLNALADKFHYSTPYISSMIKKSTGCNFSDLIKELRMSDARKYLVNSNLHVGEIAALVGYNSTDHFSRVFRNACGMSPHEYRKSHRAKEPAFVPFMDNVD